MISSLSKLVLLLGALAVAGCAVGADPGEGEETVSSALGGGEEAALGGSDDDGNSTGNGLKPEAPREKSPYSLVPQDCLIPTDPSPWKSPGPPR